MKKQACDKCGATFTSERSGAGALRTRICPGCLEGELFDKKLSFRQVKESWFRLVAIDPPPSVFERKIDLEEWRTCSECKRRFKTSPEVLSRLCPPCLERKWESRLLSPTHEISLPQNFVL